MICPGGKELISFVKAIMDLFGHKMNSKALKGVVEQWLRAEDVPDHYIAQGAFLIAAFSEGYVIDKTIDGCPNVYLKKK